MFLKGHSFFLFLDINECTSNQHNCDVNAYCTDTVGSFNCTCNPGYIGNGALCTGKHLIIFVVSFLKCRVFMSDLILAHFAVIFYIESKRT